MNKKRILLIILVVVVFIIGFCILKVVIKDNIKFPSNNVDTSNIDITLDSSISITEELDEYDLLNGYDESAIKITLNGTSALCNSSAVSINNGGVTIKKAGTYEISGTLSDGNLVIDTDKNSFVRVILNSVNITSKNTSAIFVKSASKVVLTLNEGSQNFLADSEVYEFESEDEEPDSAIYSKDNLTINGSGTLNVDSNYNDAIICKDTLKILDTNISVNSVDDGIKGKDLLYIKNSNIDIVSGGDSLKSTNDTDTTLGNLYLENSKINIEAKQDGIQSQNVLKVLDCNISIKTGEGSSKSLSSVENYKNDRGGFVKKEETVVEDTSSSMKGIKSVNEIKIDGGNITIDSQDDAIHSNGTLVINSGEFDIKSGDDGIHADTTININGGDINIEGSYEGIESGNVLITGGNIYITAEDDGINIAGGNDFSSMMQRPGMNTITENENETYLLRITGGYLWIDASGDGLDSNGSIDLSGGIVLVNGPTNGGNGSLDYSNSFKITGGTIIAAGTSDMMQTATSNSTQNTLAIVFDSYQTENTIFNIKDSSGNDVITFASSKKYNSIVVSTSDLKNGKYTINLGGSYSNDTKDGLYTDGTYSDGVEYEEVTVKDVLTNIGNMGMMNNMNNMNNNMNPQNNMEKPNNMMNRPMK